MDKHDKEMHLTGKYAGFGEIIMTGAVLFLLEKFDVVDAREVPWWGIGVAFVLGLYCIWRGRRHH